MRLQERSHIHVHSHASKIFRAGQAGSNTSTIYVVCNSEAFRYQPIFATC
jgi:hypothetical protein